MINKNDILNALRDGVSIDDISEELAAALNDAFAEYDAENEAKEKENSKVDEAQKIVDIVHDFMIDYYGNSKDDIDAIEEIFDGLDGKFLCESLESAFNMTKNFALAQSLVKGTNGKDLVCGPCGMDSLFAVLDQIREEEEAKEKKDNCDSKCNCKKTVKDISAKEADKVIKSFLDLL